MPASTAPGPDRDAPPVPAAYRAALRSELIAALDHDLRTSLTTVLGALQSAARAEFAGDDPDLAALLSAAVTQAQKMRRLLDELPAAAAPDETVPLLPAEMADLIRRAGGDHATVTAEVPDDLGEVGLPAPGLRRALAGILARVGPPGRAVRVVVSARGTACHLTITAGSGRRPEVAPSIERLVAAMGGSIEHGAVAASPAVRLVFPGAMRASRD